MAKKILERIKEKKYYLIITVLFFVFLIFINQPFDKENYKYVVQNAENLIGYTDFLISGNKVSQTFTSERNELVKVGIKTVTQDRLINSNVNIKIKEIETGKIIYDKNISLSEAKNDVYFEIEIDKQKESKDKEYEIIITSLDAVKENATMFALAENAETSNETYKFNEEEIKENKMMIMTEYYNSKSEIFHMALWYVILALAILFILFGLENADEKTFLKLAIGFAILYIFVIPFPHYLDEGAHFFRAFMVSQGDFYDEMDEKGEIGGYVPVNFRKYIFKGLTPSSFSTDTVPTGDLFSEDKEFLPFKYFSSTIPTGHTIPAIGLWFGNIINLSGYLTIYLSRLLPYAFYVVCSYFAIKNLKYYKSILFILATLPITLYVAGSVSLDPIINGSAFLFISICLKYYFEAEDNTYISKKDIALLIITAIFIVTNKYLTYTPLLLLFFLIPKKKFKTKKAYIIMLVVSVIIGLLCVLWQFYMLNKFPYEEDRNGYVNQKEQLAFMLEHPIFVAKVLMVNCFGTLKLQGVYTAKPLGAIADLVTIAMIVGTILEQNKFDKPKKKKILSITLITVFIIALVLANIALYLSFTKVGDDIVSGYQNRYNVPIFLLLFIPLANCFNLKNEIPNYGRKLAFFMLLVNLDAMLTILLGTFIKQ